MTALDAPPQPLNYPLSVYRGDTGGWRFILWSDTARTQPVDLTGATVAAQMRDKPDGLKVIALTCTVTLPNIIDVALDPASSAQAVGGAWDLQVTFPDGTVTTVAAGRVYVTADITQP
jgi:hypothetical protein